MKFLLCQFVYESFSKVFCEVGFIYRNNNEGLKKDLKDLIVKCQKFVTSQSNDEFRN